MGPLIGAQQLASHPEAERRLTPTKRFSFVHVKQRARRSRNRTKGALSVAKLADLVALAMIRLRHPRESREHPRGNLRWSAVRSAINAPAARLRRRGMTAH